MKQYVRKDVSTQAIENFWSCLKRTLGGTYIAVEPCHLDLYLNEQVFRFNHRRDTNDGQRFRKALRGRTGTEREKKILPTWRGRGYPGFLSAKLKERQTKL